MAQIRKILCPVDFFPASLAAAKQAGALANRYNARLILLHVVEPVAPWADGVPLKTRGIIETITEKSLGELKKVANLPPLDKVRPEVIVQTGLVDVVIESTVRAQSVDFVVMGTHGRRIERYFLGSTTERFLRKLSVPLLTIRQVPSSRVQPIRHIMVTTDFGEGSSRAIEYGWSLASKHEAKMTLVHVLDDVQADVAGIYREHLLRGIESQLENLLPSEARSKRSIRVLIGRPFRRILWMVENERIDLIVMNIHKKTAMQRLSIGSTAEKIIRAANVPVLAVPSTGSTTPNG
jgi:nucleotide-binding universal stress UspA family protein